MTAKEDINSANVCNEVGMSDANVEDLNGRWFAAAFVNMLTELGSLAE